MSYRKDCSRCRELSDEVTRLKEKKPMSEATRSRLQEVALGSAVVTLVLSIMGMLAYYKFRPTPCRNSTEIVSRSESTTPHFCEDGSSLEALPLGEGHVVVKCTCKETKP